MAWDRSGQRCRTDGNEDDTRRGHVEAVGAGTEPGTCRGIRRCVRCGGEAWTAHLTFLRDLAAEGVSMTTLQQVRITESDDGCDPLAVIGRALNRAAERGYHDPNAVPPEWLAR